MFVRLFETNTFSHAVPYTFAFSFEFMMRGLRRNKFMLEN